MSVSVRKTILTIVRITRGINFSLGKCHIDSAVEILLIIVKFIVIAFICQNKMDIKNGSKKPSSLGEEPCWGKLPVLNHGTEEISKPIVRETKKNLCNPGPFSTAKLKSCKTD